MAYETSRVRRGRGKGKTLATLPKDSSKNKAVARVYKKARRAPKGKVAENKDAVLTLARQVKALQNAKYGSIQSRSMELSFPSSVVLTDTEPFGFLVNNMYNNYGVYQGNITTGTPGFTQVATFNKYDYLTDIAEQYQWNARQGTDLVSPIQYKPIFTRINMRFRLKFAGPGPSARVRVTYLTLKNPLTASDKINVNLPGVLGAYRNLAINASSQKRNAFNPRFHKILYDKWISFKNVCRTTDEKANVDRRLSIPFKYNDSDVLRPDYDNFPLGQLFWTNIPLHQQVWCIISCNTEMNEALSTLTMDRQDSWRDLHGIKG